MRIGIVGCGYVADYYCNTLGNHPQLELAGVTDLLPERAASLSKRFGNARIYDSFEQMLADDRVELIVNLTNPKDHYAVSSAALAAGKHVYSEKPLAMCFEDAQTLVEQAARAGRMLSCAPCSTLSETVKTLRRELDRKVIGKVFLVYAELDDGMTHREHYRRWISETGKPWPWKDEFEVGVTIEHAAYFVTWMVMLFGAVTRVTAFSRVVVEDKQTDAPLDVMTPDFSVACLEFESGVTARVTCSIVAPRDRSLRIIGEDGVLSVREAWNYQEPVLLEQPTRLRNWGQKHPLLKLLWPGIRPQRVPLEPGPRDIHRDFVMPYPMDFSRGIADMADAIARGGEPSITPAFALHVNEVVLTMQHPERMGQPREILTRP